MIDVLDDRQETESILRLRAEGKAMEARIQKFVRAPSDTLAQRQAFVDEINQFIKAASAFRASAFYWKAKGRPAYERELRLLSDYLADRLAFYAEQLRNFTVFTRAMAPSLAPLQYAGPNSADIAIRMFMNQCVACGRDLPPFRVSFCPVCKSFPYRL
jgi:hypothetical protein